jgi:hypothetical protein
MENPITRPQKGDNRDIEDFIRPDGRMEVYDVPPAPDGSGYECFWCSVHPKDAHKRYQANEIFVASPINAPDALAKFICVDHCPPDVVIYDPRSKTCRDKTGTNVWRETVGAAGVIIQPQAKN